MSAARRGDAPTLGIVVTGGVGVLVVLAFVGVVVFGRTTVEPGDRLAVVSSDAPGRISILVGRCDDERVNAVDVRVAGGDSLWRIESAKGVIDRSFAVGEEPPPFGAVTAVALRPLPAGRLEALVAIGDEVDREAFDPTHLETADAPEAPCDRSDLGLVPLLFVAGAAGVVLSYGALVRRFLQAR